MLVKSSENYFGESM